MKYDIQYWASELSEALANPDKTEMSYAYISQLIYLFEAEISKIKRDNKLSSYNSNIYSKKIAQSFVRTREDLFGQFREPIRPFTKTDYQYYLLVFLLIYFCEMKDEKLTLHQIIDKFVDLHKEHSLSYKDIKLTATGVTRCKTNLRFAFEALKEMGLVKLYHREEKEKSWMLTYLGFMVAASIIYKPDWHRPVDIASGIKHCSDEKFFEIDRWIIERTIDLSNEKFFNEILGFLYPDSLTNSEIEKGLWIFYDYRGFMQHLKNITPKSEKPKHRTKVIREFFDDLEKKHLLDEFMNELSKKFNAEAFLAKIWKIFGYRAG